MDDQYSDPSSNSFEQKLRRSLSDYLSGTNDQPPLDQDSAPYESGDRYSSEGDDEQPDTTQASVNDVIGDTGIRQALRQSHDRCLVKLLAEPTTDGWMAYQESFKDLKSSIASMNSAAGKHACCLELYKQAHDAFSEYFSDKAKTFKVEPKMSMALCGHAYLCQPYTLSQAEAAHLRAANFPLDESPYLFKFL